MSSYRNLKNIPTAKLIQILDSHHTTGINGADYGPVKEELQQILWERQSRSNDHVIERYWQEYQDHLDSESHLVTA